MKYLILLLGCIVMMRVSAQVKPYSYTVNIGLSDHKLYSLSKDRFGRLILATNRGVYSYNGFKSGLLNTTNLKSSEFTEIIEVGNACFGLNKAGQLVQIGIDKLEVIGNEIREEIEWIKRADSQLVVCTGKELLFCQSEPFKVQDRISVPFLEGGKKQIWDYVFFKGEHYALLSSGELIAVKEKTSRIVPEKNAHFLAVSEDGIWLIPEYSGKQNTYLFSGLRFTNRHRILNAVTRKTDRLIQYNDRIYLCSDGSLACYGLKEQKVFFQLTGYHVQDVLQEANGTVWVATLRKGLLCMPSGSYTLVSSTEFTALDKWKDAPGLVGLDVKGNLVQITEKGAVMRTVHTFNAGLDYTGLNSVSDQVISAGAYLFTWNKTVRDYPVGDPVKGLFSLEGNQMLVAGNFGLRLYASGELSVLSDKKAKYTSLSEDPVRSIVQLTPETYLLQLPGGVKRFNLKDRTFRDLNYYGEAISALQMVSYEQKAVIITTANELLVYDGNKIIQKRDLKEVNADIKIQKVKQDGAYLYFLSENNLYRLNGIHGTLERLEQLARMNGLYLRDFVIKGNKVYMATQFGVYQFEWLKLDRDFPTFIVGEPSGNFELPSRQHKHIFQYSNTWVRLPFEVVELGESHPFALQYRLIRNGEMKDTTWIRSSLNLNALTFEHLEGGDYCIELRLKDPYSSAHSKSMKRYFSVEYHWTEYKFIWFVAGLFFAFAISAYIRKKELKKRLS